MTLRIFIAFDVEPGARLCRVIGQLEQIGSPIRVSRSMNLHLTLQFLGDTEEDRIPVVIEAMNASLADESAVDVVLQGLDVFPNRRKPTVLWAGLRDDSAVCEIRSCLELRLNEAGWERDDRVFQPHVTVARINPRRRVPDVVSELLDQHNQTDFNSCRLNRVVLYQSQIGAHGVEHLPLHEIRLS